MNKTRLFATTAFAFAIAAVFFTARMEAQPDTVKQIAPGVWFRQGDIDGKGHCNNVIIEMKDYLVVVDANFPDGARLTMADAAKVSKKPIKWVFDTHHHGDHAYANAVWNDRPREVEESVTAVREPLECLCERLNQLGGERTAESTLELPSSRPRTSREISMGLSTAGSQGVVIERIFRIHFS